MYLPRSRIVMTNSYQLHVFGGILNSWNGQGRAGARPCGCSCNKGRGVHGQVPCLPSFWQESPRRMGESTNVCKVSTLYLCPIWSLIIFPQVVKCSNHNKQRKLLPQAEGKRLLWWSTIRRWLVSLCIARTIHGLCLWMGVASRGKYYIIPKCSVFRLHHA